MYQDDAFPNSEQIFTDAFALPDPAPELLKLIKAHPKYHTVVDLLVTYTIIVEENPSRASSLAASLARVCDSDPPDAPIIAGSSLAELFSDKLVNLHSKGFAFDDDIFGQTNDMVFGPTNEYLTASLLSGMSFKYNLASSSDQYGTIMVGLDAPCDRSSISEVRVIGSCIQLLINGSEIVPSGGSYFRSANAIANKLKGQKAAGTVKNPNALKVLELTISHAETGFKKENDMDNVWDLLFPETISSQSNA